MKTKGKMISDWVRSKSNSPNDPPAMIADFMSRRSSQRMTTSITNAIPIEVAKSVMNIFVLAVRVLEEIHSVVSSRKMAKRATVTPAAREWSFAPRKYNATGNSANTNVCAAMTLT